MVIIWSIINAKLNVILQIVFHALPIIIFVSNVILIMVYKIIIVLNSVFIKTLIV